MKNINEKLKNMKSFPKEYKIELNKIIKEAKQIFKGNLCNLTLGGSGGKGNIINGWSDLDIYIILYEYDVKRVLKFMDKIKNDNIHIGTTFYTLKEVELDLVDVKTRVMCYEQQNYDVNPILYGNSVFKQLDFKSIIDDNLCTLPNVIHDFRRRYIELINNEQLQIDKTYIKKLLVLVKCILVYFWIFSFGYVETIENFKDLCKKIGYKLTDIPDFDIMNAINNLECSKKKLLNLVHFC